MIFSLLSQFRSEPRIAIAVLLMHVVLITLALICHEVAHGYMAYKLGDPTAKQEGRLTLNPLDHLDPIGFLMLLLLGFGYAKPVPVNIRNLRNPRRDMALVSLAGPMANLALAVFGGLIYGLLCALGNGAVLAVQVFALVLQIFVRINVGLMLFNLIPLPPLDGSNILLSFLSPMAAAKYLKVRYYTRYIFLGIIALSWLSDLGGIFAVINGIIWFPFDTLWGLICNGIFLLGRLLFSFL